MMLKWLIAAVIIYGGFVALPCLAQRSLQYFPERRRTPPSAVGLTKAEEMVLGHRRQRTCDSGTSRRATDSPYFSIFTARAVRCAGGTSAFTILLPMAAAS